MYVRRKKTRKALVLDTALSVGKVQPIGSYEEVEAEIREEIPRLKTRKSRCSKCDKESHTCRTCSN
jgi:hypothetical protein